MKGWKIFNDECPCCGNNPVDVLTSAQDGYAHDGDDVECFGCGMGGMVMVDENDDGIGIAHTIWDEGEE